MFRQLNNIESAFKHVRLFTMVIIVVCAALCGYCIYFSMQRVVSSSEKIYILSGGRAFEANASTRSENLVVEARDHVSSFHELFFSLSPDMKAIEAKVSKALYLADHSAKDAFDDLEEKGYFASVISGNVSQEVHCDSVVVNTSLYPYSFRYYGRQRIIRSSVIITRSLITEGQLRNVDRTDNNSHGFLIEKWVTLQNKDLSMEKR